VVERRDRAAVATFFCAEPLVAGRIAALGEGEVRHAHVRRIAVGERVRLLDGAGMAAWGAVVRLTRSQGMIEVDRVEQMDPPPQLHLMLPVADRDRMLLLAEKATELGITSWRPVLWRRSRGVSPRGEGVAFQAKVRARMVGALTQSGGAWLPAHFPDAPLERAIAACPPGARWLLDAEGDAPLSQPASAPLTVAVGPEGGLEPEERAMLLDAGFVPITLAPHTLRFETAAIAGLALARAVLFPTSEEARA
jgi:16S rRNA (uracil1498-N3)-methyltransferase